VFQLFTGPRFDSLLLLTGFAFSRLFYQVNDMLAGVGENSMSSFDRMKEKVEQLETQVRGFTYFQGIARLK